jgi:hypothetical protein
MKLDHKKIAAVCLAVGLCAVCLAPPVRASESAESCSLDKAGKQTPRVESTGAAASATQQPLSGIANLSTHACLAGVWDASVKARQIVDIRPANIFNSLQAANSLNIAMGSLAHREFLKLAPVLLIGDGKADFELTAMCEPLRASGFKDVRVLKGGLRTLHLEDYPIVGNPRAIEALDTLSPQELHNLVGRDAWKVLATKSDAAEATRLGIRVDAEVTAASDVSKRLFDNSHDSHNIQRRRNHDHAPSDAANATRQKHQTRQSTGVFKQKCVKKPANAGLCVVMWNAS